MAIQKLFSFFNSFKSKKTVRNNHKLEINKPVQRIKVDDDFSIIKQAFIDLGIDITDMSVKKIENELDKRIINNIGNSLQQTKDSKGEEATRNFFAHNENHNLVILKAHLVSLKWWFDNNL
ncbi:MAG TPA: hypothetical protein VKY41_10505 [Xanthomarina sp.]|nr:hypothetical protein [Xanthomarina sp.]